MSNYKDLITTRHIKGDRLTTKKINTGKESGILQPLWCKLLGQIGKRSPKAMKQNGKERPLILWLNLNPKPKSLQATALVALTMESYHGHAKMTLINPQTLIHNMMQFNTSPPAIYTAGKWVGRLTNGDRWTDRNSCTQID